MADVILSSFSEKGAVLAALDLVPVLEWNGTTYDNKTILGSRIADTTDLALKVNSNTAITPGNGNKISVDAKGLVLTVGNEYATLTTGSVISFTSPIIWNTFGTPSVADLTADLTGAKIGAIQKIYHNKAVEPTYPAGWVKMGTGTYTVSVLNVIFAEWVSGTRVEYWITKPV